MDTVVYNTGTTPTKKTIKMRFNYDIKLLRKLEADPEVMTIHCDNSMIYADIGYDSEFVTSKPAADYSVEIVTS